MNKKSNKEFSLVEGTFTSDEAREVLMSLVKSKLTFHNLKKLQTFEKSGQINLQSEKRIEELKIMRDEILQLITYAEDNGLKLQINSTIDVEFTKIEDEASLQAEI